MCEDGPPIAVRALQANDAPAAVAVINAAAAWYAEFLPPAEVAGPEMTLEDWAYEAGRMTWYGAFDGPQLVGVMGLEYMDDVALLRHAYVQPERQRQGIASALYDHLQAAVHGVDRLIVGTYAANYKARAALAKFGFSLSPDSQAVLRRYYDIPAERRRASVTYEKDFLRWPAAPEGGSGPLLVPHGQRDAASTGDRPRIPSCRVRTASPGRPPPLLSPNA